MKHPFVWLWLLTGSLLPAFAQSPYTAGPRRVAASTGLVLTLGAEGLMRQVPPFDAAQLAQLDARTVWRPDRGTIGNWNPGIARLSDVGLYGSMVAPPLLALLHPRSRQAWPTLTHMWASTGLLTYGLTGVAKWAIRRPRPLAYLPADPAYPGLATAQAERDARFSMLSGHSAITAAMCFFSAQVYADLFPHSPARPVVWALAVLLPASVAWMRVRAGKHYPSDVVMGYVVGAAVGLTVPRWYRR